MKGAAFLACLPTAEQLTRMETFGAGYSAAREASVLGTLPTARIRVGGGTVRDFKARDWSDRYGVDGALKAARRAIHRGVRP